MRIGITICLALSASAFAQDESQEKKLQVHRFAMTETAPWDAFEYLNRLAAKPEEGESAHDFAGRILGNIANVEGRVLVKVPPGWERLAYDGFKMFFNTTGMGTAANCGACHVPAGFEDGLEHAGADGKKVATPTLRNLAKSGPYLADESAKTVEDAVRAHLALKDDEDADPEYRAMKFAEKDVAALVAFLKQLNEVPEEEFRPLILNHSILDTTYLWE